LGPMETTFEMKFEVGNDAKEWWLLRLSEVLISVVWQSECFFGPRPPYRRDESQKFTGKSATKFFGRIDERLFVIGVHVYPRC